MADVDISGMPEPKDIGLDPAAQGDPTADMPHPSTIGLQPPPDPRTNPFDPFNPAQHPILAMAHAVATDPEARSALTGIPKVLAEANPVTPRVAFAAGRVGAISGSVGAALDSAAGRPDAASADLEEGNRRAKEWSDNIYKFAGYVPSKLATKEGNEFADTALSAPGKALDAVAGTAAPVADLLTSDVDIAYDDQGNPIAGPGGVTHNLSQRQLENISDTAKDVLGGFAAVGGVPDVKGSTRSLGRVTNAARTALLDRGIVKPTPAEIEAGYVPKPKKTKPADTSAATPVAPDVGEPVTAETLRAQPNPIPPPEGTPAHEAQRPPAQPDNGAGTMPYGHETNPVTPPTEAPELGNQPQDMSLDPQARAAERARIAAERAKQIGLTGELEPEPVPANAAAVEGAAKKRDAMTDEERAAYDQANRIPTTGETAEQLQARLNAEADARGRTGGSRETPPAVPSDRVTSRPSRFGGSQSGATRLFPEDDGEGSRLPLFAPPTKDGPQETPAPEQQAERAGHLDKLDNLSGRLLPNRRISALTGDYNATGDDFQTKEVEPAGGPMKTQIASENKALHAAAENTHQGTGSQFANSVDPQTVSNRGRVIRNAVNAIQKHFEDATDGFYNVAREQNQGRPIPKLSRVEAYLNDDSNFANDAEIGLQKAAQARLKRLWSTGDPDRGVPPGSVNAAERLREFLNEKGKNPSAMGVAGDLKRHLDEDVAEHGGPGMFAAARNMRRHQYQMLEEPTGIKKLLAPSDSQGINHAIPTEKVADYVADLPKDQHDHVLNVLRAGAHLSPEIAEASAAAMRELQAHVVSRIHDAATNKSDGSWNARTFHNAAAGYGPKLPSLFKDNPKVVENLQTLSRAGNVLKMDKHYPGAGAQIERTGMAGHALEAGGKIAASVAHEIPFVGRLVGRAIESGVEGAGGRLSEASRARETAKRFVDRNGKSRGSVQLFNDNDLNQGRDRDTFHGKTVERNPRSEFNANSRMAGGPRLTPEQQSIIDKLGGRPLGERVGGGKQRGAVGEPSQRDAITHKSAEREDGTVSHLYGVPEKGGGLGATEYPDRGVTQVMTSNVNNKGQGWGTRMLQRAADDAHARGQVLHSDAQVSDGQAGAYSNLKKLGYDVRTKPNDHVQGEYKAVGDHVFEVRPGASNKQSLGERMGGKQRGAVGDTVSGDDVVKHVMKVHYPEERTLATKDPKQRERDVRELLGPDSNSSYRRVEYPLDRIHNDTPISSGVIDRYAKLKTPYPAIVMNKAGEVRDGNHRIEAARKRGDETIPAYVPIGHRIPGERGSVRVMDDEEAPRSEEEGSQLNIGLHQGQEGDKNFRKMSKQEAQAAVESTGAKVTKNTVLTPKQHGVYKPTSVISTDRPLTDNEMQRVLAKTKQSAIPQRTGQGDESMHVAPGHEETAKKEGWDSFNPDYFREHDGRTMSDAMKNPSAPNPYPPHPDATVKDPVRSAFPGIYDDPKEIMARLGPGQPESPHLKEIFGKTRKDLHDDAIARGDVEPKTPIPGITQKGKGSAHAQQVKTPENAERIRNIIQAYKEHDPSGYHGMVGWYEMDPMYHSIKKILGGSKDAADKVFHTLNSLTAYASPMSDVGTEIKRGTAAATMAAEGNFDTFAKQGNLPQGKAPAALKAQNFELGNAGTMAHGSQVPAMGRFLETGQEANAVKTGTYRRSSDAPSRTGSEHQNTQPVGDSHWSRGVGLADVRGAKGFEGSADGPEMKVLGKWFHDEVARHPDTNLPSTSAQAVQWGALSKETGVGSPIGAPKLEIWADMIADAAKREGIPPKEMWTRIVKRLAK